MLPAFFDSVLVFDTASGEVVDELGLGEFFDGAVPGRIALGPEDGQIVGLRSSSHALDRYVLSEQGGGTSRGLAYPTDVLVVPGRLDLLFADGFESGGFARWSWWTR
jgi:hypothetical protein